MKVCYKRQIMLKIGSKKVFLGALFCLFIYILCPNKKKNNEENGDEMVANFTGKLFV